MLAEYAHDALGSLRQFVQQWSAHASSVCDALDEQGLGQASAVSYSICDSLRDPVTCASHPRPAGCPTPVARSEVGGSHSYAGPGPFGSSLDSPDVVHCAPRHAELRPRGLSACALRAQGALRGTGAGQHRNVGHDR